MANDIVMTIVGNLTADPELRYTQNGVPVLNFTVAQTPRSFDKAKNEWVDGEAVFLRCSLWREPAENAASTLTKGMRVILTGKFRVRSYEKDGQKRFSNEVEVDEIGPSMRYAQAAVQKVQRDGMTRQQPPAEDAYAGHNPDAQPAQQPFEEPWSTPESFGDETPF